jgi:hypothetical protein
MRKPTMGFMLLEGGSGNFTIINARACTSSGRRAVPELRADL